MGAAMSESRTSEQCSCGLGVHTFGKHHAPTCPIAEQRPSNPQRVTNMELASMIAWYEGDARPSGDRLTKGHMARALRELQDRRDAEQRTADETEPKP
jgi:hypothetical protein